MHPDNPSPYAIRGPQPAQRPVLITVPHAGRHYPDAVLRAARVPQRVLQRLEDRFADRLADAAVAAGFTVVEARVARAAIDLNRAEDDMDPAAILSPGGDRGRIDARFRPSARARAGLGLIPHRLSGEGALWREPVPLPVLDTRIAQLHRPYHQRIGTLLAAMRKQWGRAILLDLHSMPTPAATAPQIVIGDRYGATARNSLSLALMAAAHPYHAARNTPYAGAHGVLRHADRAGGIDAVQIEIDRGLYLTSDDAPDHVRLPAMAQLVLGLAHCAEQSISRAADSATAGWPIAAE